MRILDSKDPRDVETCLDAPASVDSLSDESRGHFDRLTRLLDRASISFTADPKLVRGFDYYTGSLWEFTATGLGAQSAVGGGGRYDNLVEQLGGRPTPGVGFGVGLERLLLALSEQGVTLPIQSKPLIWIAHHGEAARDEATILSSQLRAADFRVDMDCSIRSMKAQLKLADRETTGICLILGEAELQNDSVILKDFKSQSQQTIRRTQIVSALRRHITD